MKPKNTNFHSLPPENVLRRLCVCLAQADWINADVYWTNDGERGWAIAIAFHRNKSGRFIANTLCSDLATCATSHGAQITGHVKCKPAKMKIPAKKKGRKSGN